MSIVWMEDAKSFKASIMRSAQMHQEYFKVKEYGSKSRAGDAAERWISKMKRELPPKQSSKNRMTTRNKSGVVGVRLDKGRNKRRGRLHFYPKWVAFWPGCQSGVGWGIGLNQYSDKDAFVLAYLSRKLESRNRTGILEEFAKVRPTSEYRRILSMKKQAL